MLKAGMGGQSFSNILDFIYTWTSPRCDLPARKAVAAGKDSETNNLHYLVRSQRKRPSMRGSSRGGSPHLSLFCKLADLFGFPTRAPHIITRTRELTDNFLYLEKKLGQFRMC